MEDTAIAVSLLQNFHQMRVIYVLLLSSLLIACNQKKKETQDKVSDGIRRYEVELFNIDTTRFEEGLAEIHPRYKVFLGETMPDTDGIKRLKSFVSDPQIRDTYNYTMQQFPDVQWLNESFTKSFAILSRELPEKKIPRVYTYISGFDIRMPVKYGDSALIIGLDLYLGSDYEPYVKMGYPKYIINRLSKEYILSDCFKEIAWANLPPTQAVTLLDAMIEQGKTIYFAEKMLAGEKEEILMKYSPEQADWIHSNEQNLWSFMIENQLLYSSDPKAFTMFMTDGPFTSGFSSDSPSRTGHWIGWQIVRKYMANNNVSMQELLDETDSQKILTKSGYKPAKV